MHENLSHVLKNQCVRKQSEMVLGKINRAVISVTLTCDHTRRLLWHKLAVHSVLQVGNCSTGDHYRESQDRASNLKKIANGSMKILRVDLQKAKNNTKNKIEGYPRVERRNISPSSFCKEFWNIPTLCVMNICWENFTAKTSEQPSAFRELYWLKFVRSSTN